MADEEDALHRCITEFMLDTCRYTKVSERDFCAFFIRGAIRAGCGDTNEVFSSGSFAEFYIKPMMSCVGDIDVMFCYRSCLAIPAGHTPPAEFLPGKFQRTVAVCEIIDSHQPGFVYLKPSYVLKKDDNGRVTAVKKIEKSKGFVEFMPRPDNQDFANMSVSKQHYFSQLILPYCVKQNIDTYFHPELFNLVSADVHGPTTEFAGYINIDNPFLICDYVDCIKCPFWPPQAADWPKRLRSHGVPDQSTIDLVVNDGCDLVAAVHPLCRQDEWMSKHQWRLSFSRAEVTLLNSWTPVQQIIYHMLRFVIKREVLSKTQNKNTDLPHLSNYHIKTLMLWECEQKPQSWWSPESNSLIKLCSSLLRRLSDCVANKHCPQYFISDCNLLDHFVEDASLTTCFSLRRLADSSVLIRWFVDHYICECVQRCPDEVSALFVSTWSSDTLTKAIHALTDWKLTSLPEERCTEHFKHESLVMSFFVRMCHILGNRHRIILIKEFQNLDQGTRDFNTAILILHVACTISIHSLTEDLLELLWTLFHPVAAKASDKTTNGGILCIRKAIALAVLCNVGSNVFEMLHNEMSKAYLHQSFAYGQESTFCLVHVLLAALYYKSGHYQTTIDHCKQVFVESGGGQFGPRYIGAEYLPPQINENIDTVFGLILLYQHVQEKALSDDRKFQPHAQSPPAFSTQLLARYLYTKCFTVATGKGDRMKIYGEHLSKTKLPLLSDVLLFKTVKVQLHECAETSIAEDTNGGTGSNALSSMDTTLLVTMLELVALDKLTTVRRELHCEQFPVVNEFEALYAYKCGLFEECLKLCRNNIDVLLRDDCFVIIRGSGSAHRLWPVPEMLSLLDGELVSVFGLIQLLHPLSMFKMADYSISVLTLLLYLIVRCHENGCSNSLDGTLNLIRFVHNVTFQAEPDVFAFDRLLSKLIYRSLKLYIETRSYV